MKTRKDIVVRFLIVISLMSATGVLADPCQDLIKALDEGKKTEAIKLINDTNNLECRDEYSLTPLLIAISRPRFNLEDTTEIVRLLVAKGVNVNARITKEISGLEGLKGSTPLMSAAAMGMDDVVKLLLDHGADIDAQADNGETAVMCAATIDDGNPTTVRLLVERGCNLNIKSITGDNVLLAVISGSDREKLETLRILIDNGVDVNCKNEKGETPLQWAAFYGHYNTIKLLLEKGANVNDADNNGKTALMLAASSSSPNEEIVKLLIESKASLDYRDKNGETAYFYALDSGNIEISKLLASAGADINPKNRVCRKILRKALKKGGR